MNPVPTIARIRLPPALVALADQALISGSNFLLVIAVGRCAGAAEFGRFTLAYSLLIFLTGLHQAFILSPLAVLLPETGVAQQAGYLAGLDRFHRRLPWLCVLVAPVAWCAPFYLPLALATAAAVCARLGQEFERRVAFAAHDSPGAAVVDVAGCLPLLVVSLALLRWQPQLLGWHAMTLLAGSAALGWVVGRIRHRAGRAATPEAPRTWSRKNWEVGKWLLAGIAVQWIADYAYPFMIAAYLGLEQTAVLNAARSIVNAGNVALNGVEAYATPRLRALQVHGDGSGFRRTAKRMAMLLAVAVGVPCALAMAFPGALMHLFYGHRYQDGVWVLAAFAGILLIRTVSRWCAVLLIAMRRQHVGFKAACINAVITLSLGPFIVAHYGIAGVVLALAVNATVFVVVQVLALRGAAPADTPSASTSAAAKAADAP